MYAVVAPGLKGIYRKSSEIDAILKLYPYARFCKLPTEEACYRWISQNSTRRRLEEITEYGTAFHSHHILMDYIVFNDTLYINYNTKKFGNVRIVNKNITLTQTKDMCMVREPFTVTGTPVQIYLLALVEALDIIGDLVDVVVRVPCHAIFYAVRSYTGDDYVIRYAQEYVKNRLGGTSITVLPQIKYDIPEKGGEFYCPDYLRLLKTLKTQ